jgi:hypothetical protein
MTEHGPMLPFAFGTELANVVGQSAMARRRRRRRVEDVVDMVERAPSSP